MDWTHGLDINSRIFALSFPENSRSHVILSERESDSDVLLGGGVSSYRDDEGSQGGREFIAVDLPHPEMLRFAPA